MFYLNQNDYLADCLPGFAGERLEPRRLISKMLSSAVPHWTLPASVFTDSWWKTSGHSKRTFDRLNSEYNLFDVGDDFEHGSALPYFPTESTRSLRDEMPRAPVRRTKKVRKSWVDVPSEAFGRTINAGGLNIVAAVPLDRDAINHFRESGWKTIQASQYHKLNPGEYWRDYANMLAAYLENTSTPDHLPCDYYYGECGRVLGVGLGFQNMRRELRTAALNGFFDYDMKNAHITIAAQEMAARNHPVPTMEAYSADPDNYRDWLASTLDVKPSKIKTALLAMLNGGGSKALTPVLGEATDAFMHHPWVLEFRNDCRAVRKVFKCKPTKILFHIEHKILKAATAGDDVMVPMFDGWVSREEQDTIELERKAQEQTGRKITITKKEIKYDFPCI